MKLYKSIIVTIMPILLTGIYCKKSEGFWNPTGTYPMLLNDGTVSNNPSQMFSFQNVSPDVKTLVVNFFAPDCQPCKDELPELEKIYKRLESESSIEYISIGSVLSTAGTGGLEVPVEKIAAKVFIFTQEYNINHPSYIGTKAALAEFGITGYPETFILNRNNKGEWYVQRRYIGAITQDDVLNYLDI